MFTAGIGRLFGRLLGRRPVYDGMSTTTATVTTPFDGDQPKVNPFPSGYYRGTRSTPGAFGKPKGGPAMRKLLRLRKQLGDA